MSYRGRFEPRGFEPQRCQWRQHNADSLAELQIPEWHREELERRLAAADADPGGAIPWEEVRQRLRKN